MKNPINRTVFDTRDLIEYTEGELKDDLLTCWKDYCVEHNIFQGAEDQVMTDELEFEDIDFNLEGFRDRFDGEIVEYERIMEFCEDLECLSDYKYGEAIIHEYYFAEYCEQLCEDIGDIPRELPGYIANHIDWDGVADELLTDYTGFDYNGETYYARG